MFSNFIYLIIALLLYTTCETPGVQDSFSLISAGLFFLIFFMFAGVCRLTFKRIKKKACIAPEQAQFSTGNKLDFEIDKAISRLSVLALFIFAADLYILKIKNLFSGIKFFNLLPTAGAVLFLSLFVLYLVIIWIFSWDVQKNFFSDSVTKKKFILSNISFSLPAFLPWFLISIIADIIQLLPFKGLKKFLSSPGGEIVYVLIFIFAVAVFGPVLIQKIWGCTPLKQGKARKGIEKLCKKANLGYADILEWNLFGGTMMTAAVMGIVPKFRYILVTPSLINNLDSDEIDAVISHEIGHVKNWHMYFYLLFFAGLFACIYSFFDPLLMLIYYSDSVLKLISLTGINDETAYSLIFSLTLIVLFIVYLRYIFGFFMRNFERQADIHVYSLMDDAYPLIATFIKIARFSRQSPEKPNWHHFNISERINFLNRCQQDRSLIEKHNKKIKLMLAIYILIMAMVCSAGYYLNFGKGQKIIHHIATEKILLEKLHHDPENPDLYILAGDYYYDTGKFKKAVQAYNNVLKIDPENIHALNNLAWLFATCKESSLRNYKKALVLSRKALDIERAPYILDTYAQACFLNHLYDRAVKASKEALAKATERYDYYLMQVKRFQERYEQHKNMKK